jgi:uncharacterized protein
VTGAGPLEILKLAIYYASYLYFIAAPLALWLVVRRRGLAHYAWAGFATVITLLAYARFVEPRILLTVEHEVALNRCFERAGAVRIAVFSDTHIGLFPNAMPIERIAAAVNAARPDMVFMAGDYTYFLHPDHFYEAFAAFADIKAPIYAVLGNHDLGLPGPDLSAPLNATLPVLGVRLIDNQPLRLSDSGFAIELVGLSDQWAGRQKLSLLEAPSTSPLLVLTHNPATLHDFRPGMHADLLVGGHTHGGQIQLPILTCLMTGVCGDFAYGLREEKGVQVFTTSGAGMVGLPMRFRVPPRVDVLNIAWRRCGD